MKRILVVGCSIVLALIVMNTNVVKTSWGLTVKAAQHSRPICRHLCRRPRTVRRQRQGTGCRQRKSADCSPRLKNRPQGRPIFIVLNEDWALRGLVLAAGAPPCLLPAFRRAVP
jgi:hypothetical protein